MEKITNKKDLLFKLLKITALSILGIFALFWIFRFALDNQMFGDFAETLSFCIVKNPYSGVYGPTTIYPPFAFLPFYIFALICKTPITNYLAHNITFDELIIHPLYITSFLLFYTICIGLIMFLSYKITRFKGWKLVYLLIIELLFAPLLFCFFRGNNIIFAVIFGMIFFWLYDSDKKWCRELSNVALACAIGVKIYPALLLLFFIKDRKWLDLVKTLIYSLIILFVPFIFIDGAFTNIKSLWYNFTTFSGEADRALSLTNISLDSFSVKLGKLLSSWWGINTTIFQSILSKILRFGLIISTTICMIISKNSKFKFKPILLCLLTYQLFQGISYAYVFSFLIIPTLFYLIEFNELNKVDMWFYGICFLIFAIPFSTIFDNFIIPQVTSIVLIVKLIIDTIKEHKNKDRV